HLALILGHRDRLTVDRRHTKLVYAHHIPSHSLPYLQTYQSRVENATSGDEGRRGDYYRQRRRPCVTQDPSLAAVIAVIPDCLSPAGARFPPTGGQLRHDQHAAIAA